MPSTPGPVPSDAAVDLDHAPATQSLATAGGAALQAAARVVDASYGGIAVPAGGPDDPTRALPLGTPANRCEELATNGDQIGQATGGCLHFTVALPAYGHGRAS